MKKIITRVKKKKQHPTMLVFGMVLPQAGLGVGFPSVLLYDMSISFQTNIILGQDK